MELTLASPVSFSRSLFAYLVLLSLDEKRPQLFPISVPIENLFTLFLVLLQSALGKSGGCSQRSRSFSASPTWLCFGADAAHDDDDKMFCSLLYRLHG